MVGGVVRGYRIVKTLGSGAMGTVYLGEHKNIGRQAAIKLLHPEFASRPALVNRFFDEARAASLVEHPGVVQIFDCDIDADSGQAFIIMEFLEGECLRDRMVRGAPVTLREAMGWIRNAADVLEAVHRIGIVHRDLKPDNVFLHLPAKTGATAPSLKILDFGVAKLSAGLDRRAAGTVEGSLLGTPTYMSPEQCRGAADVDWRADVYALGCIFFELLAGRPPFLGDTVGALVSAHLIDAPPDLASLGCAAPTAVHELVARMLAKNPLERPTIQEIVQVLDRHTLPATARTQVLPRQTGAVAVAGGTIPQDAPESAAGGRGTAPLTTTLAGAASAVEQAPAAKLARTARKPLVLVASVASVVAVAAIVIWQATRPAPARPAPPAAGEATPRPRAGERRALTPAEEMVPAAPVPVTPLPVAPVPAAPSPAASSPAMDPPSTTEPSPIPTSKPDPASSDRAATTRRRPARRDKPDAPSKLPRLQDQDRLPVE